MTQGNLRKRGHQLVVECILCEIQTETISHLFLHCKWTDQLWRMFICLKGIKWVKPGSIAGVLRCWNKDGMISKEEERWKIVPASIWWSVWIERNKRSFGIQSNLQILKMNCLGLFLFWCEQKRLAQTEDIFDVLDFLSG